LCDRQLERNRYYVKSVAGVIQFLAEKELALRDDWDGETETGLFQSLFQYTLRKDTQLQAIVATIPINAKYTSPDIQNEIITIMADMVIQEIITEISSATSFTLKCDETRDSVGIENLSVVIRYVFDGKVKEELVSLTDLKQFDAEYISNAILECLNSLGIDSKKMLSQCYDGASVMSDNRGGVQKLLQQKFGKSVPYVHCFNHVLHLVVVHVFEKEKLVQQFFDVCGSLYNFTRKGTVSQHYSGAALRRLLEQRWTGHLETTCAVLESMEDLAELLTDILDSAQLSAVILTETGGLLRLLQRKDLCFAGLLVRQVLMVLKPVNLLLQGRELNILAATHLISTTLATLRDMRVDTAAESALH
jgi:Domain of unknown function (DUF4371)